MLTQILNDSQQSLYRVQCRQTLAIALQLVRCRHSVLLNYWEETTQPRHPIAGLPLLEFSPALESWSDIYTGPTSCLFIPQIFSAFVFYPPSLSVTRLGCSLNVLSSTSWVDTPLTADWLRVCFGTRSRLSFLMRFWKQFLTVPCSIG